MNHWAWSCHLNAFLLGNPSEPLCSRIYRQPACPPRRAFLRLMDWYFEEDDHCLIQHVRWILLRHS